MTVTPMAKRFNLYYIFKEDKERIRLPINLVEDMWKNALLAAKPPNCPSLNK